ncbi:MAG TPA: hypothetical protein VEG30_11515 [Terriglobales bacterium]|nr:hypothetical protein [Terriglobales bacterium]
MSELGGPFLKPPVEEEGGRWIPVAIGAAVLLIIVGAVFFFSRKPAQSSGPVPEAPYAATLQVSDLKLSQAHNFVGAIVTYLEGKIANLGGKSVVDATVEVVFRNSLGEVVQREAQPLRLLRERPGYNDTIPLSDEPLTPNANREFRLTFEHISADWNQGIPEIRFIKITTQ